MVFLYTTAEQLTKYVADGVLPARITLSRNPVWDWVGACASVSDNGGISLMDKEQTAQHGGGLGRIVLPDEVARIKWDGAQIGMGVQARALLHAALQAGAKSASWRWSNEPIPREKWLKVERWNGTAWVDVTSTGA